MGCPPEQAGCEGRWSMGTSREATRQDRVADPLRSVARAGRPARAARVGPAPVGRLGALQRDLGNRATCELLQVAQAKLEVGASDDPYEREADVVARAVVRALGSPTPAPAETAQPEVTPGPGLTPAPEAAASAATGSRPAAASAPGGDAADSRLVPQASRLLRRSPEVGAAGGTVSAETEGAIQRARRNGRPIEDSARSAFEQAFGRDLSAVRIHDGPDAAELNRRVQARAFTLGQDIFLGAGAPGFGTGAGRELLAHELTHTIQQSGGA